jgi:hypothetical protein
MHYLNAIIANRASGTFSADPYKAVDELIGYTLDRLAKIGTFNLIILFVV